MARGVVKFFKAEKGWGAISSDELVGSDAFVHFSVIDATGYRMFEPGDVVEFEFERAQQDSFRFRATSARLLSSGPAPVLRRFGNQVVVAPDGTPDTPLTPRRQR